MYMKTLGKNGNNSSCSQKTENCYMISDLVSIIVPVYNAEKYIHQCIDSLLAQTFTNIEVILVDDGSSDNSGVICDEYAAKDGRVKVIHQQNGGVSVARQTGIDNAAGEYSIHADPDDWVEPNMIKELVAKAKADDADMVICDFICEGIFGQTYNSSNLPSRPSTDDLIHRLLFQQLHGSCWNKLVKRVCSNSVAFTPQHICIYEDLLYNVRLLKQNIKVSYLPKAFYHYRTSNTNSICNNITGKIIASKKDVIAVLSSELEIKEEDLYVLKKSVLYDLLQSNHTDLLKTTYPEIHNRIRLDKFKWQFFAPLHNALYIAVQGHLRIAYLFLQMNLKCIKWIQQLRRLIKCIS